MDWFKLPLLHKYTSHQVIKWTGSSYHCYTGPSPRIKKWYGGGNHRVPTAREGGEHERGTPPLVRGLRGSPQRKFWIFSGFFLRLGPDFSLNFLLEKIFLGAAKQNRLQIVTIVLLFSSAYFLDMIMSPTFLQVWQSTFSTDPWLSWANPEGGGTGGPDPPWKSHKFRVSKQYWSRSPEKSQSYEASIQCWAIIGPPMMARLWWYFDPPSPHQLKKSKLDLLWHNFLDPRMVVLQRVVFSKRYT